MQTLLIYLAIRLWDPPGSFCSKFALVLIAKDLKIIMSWIKHALNDHN